MTFPKKLKHGAYTAVFLGISDPDSSFACAKWDIRHEQKIVGAMYESAAYGWGRPCVSMNKLVWSGSWPEGASDPRSPNYGMLFDSVAHASYAEALAAFAKRADRLIAWRKARAA